MFPTKSSFLHVSGSYVNPMVTLSFSTALDFFLGGEVLGDNEGLRLELLSYDNFESKQLFY